MTDEPVVRPIAKICFLFVKAQIGFGVAWLFWQLAVPGFEAFVIFAAIFVLGGIIATGKAVFHLVLQIWKWRTTARFKRSGANPKADAMAQTSDLKSKGLTR